MAAPCPPLVPYPPLLRTDLVRYIDPCPKGTNVNFVRASSYGSGTQSSGEVGLRVDLDLSVTKGRHVLVVEDIVDTGLTLTKLKAHLLQVGAGGWGARGWGALAPRLQGVEGPRPCGVPVLRAAAASGREDVGHPCTLAHTQPASPPAPAVRHACVQECGAASVSVACLLDKQARRKVDITPEYTGFMVRGAGARERARACVQGCEAALPPSVVRLPPTRQQLHCLAYAHAPVRAPLIPGVHPMTQHSQRARCPHRSAPTSSWWGTAWTTMSCTGHCRTSAC